MHTADLVPPGFARSGLHIQPGPDIPTRFQVIGERSSGTNYMKRLLGRNTPLTPTEALGWKHGTFQALAVPRDMVVILSVRNAADWALSMFAKPWHTPAAMQALELGGFLRARWETIIDHPKYFPGIDAACVGQPLQQDRDPLTGRAYANLFRLRTGKLASHLGIVNRGCACVIVRQESVLADPQAFLRSFRSQLGLPSSDAPLRPVVKRLGARFNAATDRPDSPAALSQPDIAFMESELDGSLESALGYAY